VQRGTGRVGAENDEMDLHIGCRNKRVRAEKSAGIAGANREQSLSEQKISQPGAGSMPPTVDHVVHRDAIRAAILHTDLKVILQVGPDPRHVRQHVDAEGAQQRRRPQPRELEELRRVECAARHDDFRVSMGNASRLTLPVFDTDRTPSGKENSAGESIGDNGEIGPAACRAQVADRRRPPTAMTGRQLEIAGAFLGGPIEVIVARKPRLFRGGNESFT
jgi:hypothetical protein